MRIQKTLFITSIVLSVALFITGILVIGYIKSAYVPAVDEESANQVQQDQNILTPFIQDKNPFNILILGGDKVNKNSDTMILVNYDPVTYKINLMSIPRDTRTAIDNKSHKINYAYPHGGIELTARTVSELLNVKIKYYVFLDTSAFRNVVDILGGVDINVPADMDYDDPVQNLHIHLKKGFQHLNGDQSEQFVRFREANHWTAELRKYYDGGDLSRIKAQQYFMKELISQKLNIQYISKVNSIIDVIYKNIETNLTINEVLGLAVNVSKFNTDSFNFIQLPGRPFDKSPYYYICDADKAREIINASFTCSSSFIDTSDLKPERYKGEDIGIPLIESPETSDADVTKNNPSNADSSLTGDQQPAP